MATCAQVRVSFGAYVLGALEDAERRELDLHVACCDECRLELDLLVPLRALLDLVAPEDLRRLEAGERALP